MIYSIKKKVSNTVLLSLHPSPFLLPAILLSDQSISQMCLTIYHFSQLIFLLLTAGFFYSVSAVLNLLADFSNTEHSLNPLYCGGKNSLSFKTFLLSFFISPSLASIFPSSVYFGKSRSNEDVLFWETYLRCGWWRNSCTCSLWY